MAGVGFMFIDAHHKYYNMGTDRRTDGKHQINIPQFFFDKPYVTVTLYNYVVENLFGNIHITANRKPKILLIIKYHSVIKTKIP